MKQNLDTIPTLMEGPGTLMKREAGFGGMDATYAQLPQGTDFSPLLKGLCNDSCHSPHWGYMLEGVFRIVYDEGNEDVLKTGDFFYLPAGHTAVVEEDMKVIFFSPEKEHGEVLAHVKKVMESMA